MRRWLSLQQQHQWPRRFFSSNKHDRRLRVAVVGGGVAGWTTALQLAHLPMLDGPIDVYTAPNNNDDGGGRDIGVGVWSTALKLLRNKSVIEQLVQKGRWVGPTAGYRVPNGDWLLYSTLPIPHDNAVSSLSSSSVPPSLLFLQEVDLLQTLRSAVAVETETTESIKVHDGSRVQGIVETTFDNNSSSSSSCWSAPLQLASGITTERDYHLIIAADGMESTLRQQYGGYENGPNRTRLTGTMALKHPTMMNSETTSTRQQDLALSSSWDDSQRMESVGLQDRNYTVYRGNAPLTDAEMGDAPGVSFQTWGTGRNMRFATVPLPGGKHRQEQVWFLTLDDDLVAAERDASRRKEMLLDRFAGWHDPIGRMVQATPAGEILAERAVSHRHCMAPILSFRKLILQKNGLHREDFSEDVAAAQGPCVVFVGDAFMTVDPILAQGFTMAMEGADAVRHAIDSHHDASSFDPVSLRRAIWKEHHVRTERLVKLLRVTDMVQMLGQPAGTNGFFHSKLLRPLVQACPQSPKATVFDAVLRYSLGWPHL